MHSLTYRIPATIVLAVLLSARVYAADIIAGDSRDVVLSALGEPEGHLKSGSVEVLAYARGHVTLVNGTVTSFYLVSPRQAFEQREAREAAAKARREAAARAQADRAAQGAAEKQRMMADAELSKRPPEDQLAAWRAFERKYPGVEMPPKMRELEKRAGRGARREEVIRRITELAREIARTESKLKSTSIFKSKRKQMERRLPEMQKELADLQVELGELSRPMTDADDESTP